MVQRKALALFSGGLDSILAVRVMLEQGLAVEALNFTSPFFMCKSAKKPGVSEAVRAAQHLGVPLKVVELGIDFLAVIKNPCHGYGSGMNPCIDCKIFFLRQAAAHMAECGADFVITGEVLGQRPMSQRRDALRLIERESGLTGLLLRPLSAQHLPPTVPEQEGWVDRTRLLAITGRSRKEQIQLAETFGIGEYPNPAGGCLLTEPSFLSKIRDVFDHVPEPLPEDFVLLKHGRHFRIGPQTKVVIGRDEGDNHALEAMTRAGDVRLRWEEGSSPLGLVRGLMEPELLETAARILLRYTKAKPGAASRLSAVCNGTTSVLHVDHRFDGEQVERFRI